jgi:integrase
MLKGTRKPNGQGYTYKNGSSYRTVIKHKGYTVTASAKTIQESKKKAKEKVKSLPNSEYGLILKQKFTLGEYLTNWLEREHKDQIAYSTYKRYESLIRNHINPHIGRYLLQELNPRLITNLLLAMKEQGQSPRSQQQTRAVLSIALNCAEDQEIIASNPIRKVRNPHNREVEINPLNLGEVKRLLKTYEGTYMSARLHIALLCGLRQGEALGLTWNNVNLLDSTILIDRQLQMIDGSPTFTQLKTRGSKRIIVLDKSTKSSLENHQKIINKMRGAYGVNWQELDLVFPKADGSFRSANTDHAHWKSALTLCGVSPRRLHDARHTAATLMYSQSS